MYSGAKCTSVAPVEVMRWCLGLVLGSVGGQGEAVMMGLSKKVEGEKGGRKVGGRKGRAVRGKGRGRGKDGGKGVKYRKVAGNLKIFTACVFWCPSNGR